MKSKVMNPKVTVILTSYNKPETVGMTIESIINQTYTNWELLIMDDASNEETQYVIKQYLYDPRITYYNSNIKDEKRFKTARYATLINTAVGKSEGEYITYITDDNLFLPKRLQLMVKFLNQNPECGVVYSEQKIRFVDADLKIIGEKVRETKGVLFNPPNIVDHCSVMHRRNIINRIFRQHGNYWDDHPVLWHNADASFWNRLVKHSAFYPIQEVLDINIKGPSSFQSLNRFLPEIIPQGTLVKGLMDEVYLIEGRKRRAIDRRVFEILKYKKDNIVSIPDPFLFKYKVGEKIDRSIFRHPQIFPNFRMLKGNKNQSIYYIENHYRRLIADQDVLAQFNFSESDIIYVRQPFLDRFPEGEPITQNISNDIPEGKLFKYESKFYLSEDSELHEISNKSLSKLNIPIESAIEINKQEFSMLNCGQPFEWMIKRWKNNS